MEKIICVFGDSIAWGAGDKRRGGWADHIKTRLGSGIKKGGYGVFVYNLGIETNTTRDLLRRFENEAAERYWKSSENRDYKRDDVCIFEIGKNDSIYVKTKDKPWVDIKEFKNNLSKLIEKARMFSSNVIFLGLAHVDESKTIPWEESGESYDNKNIEEYNSAIKGVCRKNGPHFVSVMNLLDLEDLEDGVHPNSEGHQKIFETVRDFLTQNKIVEDIS